MRFYRWLSFFCLIGALQAGPYDSVVELLINGPSEDPAREAVAEEVNWRDSAVESIIDNLSGVSAGGAIDEQTNQRKSLFELIIRGPSENPPRDPVDEEFKIEILQRLRVIDLQVNELRNQLPLILEEMMRFATAIVRMLETIHLRREIYCRKDCSRAN